MILKRLHKFFACVKCQVKSCILKREARKVLVEFCKSLKLNLRILIKVLNAVKLLKDLKYLGWHIRAVVGAGSTSLRLTEERGL